MLRYLLVIVALLAAALLAGRASSASTKTYTVQLDRRTLVTALDAKPKGRSSGDLTVFSATVRSGAEAVGRLEGITTAIDPRYEGVSFSFVVFLPGGTLTLAGGGFNKHVPGLPPHLPNDLAVTGGTGSYAGVGGVASLQDVGPTTQRLTLKLRP
ncbi:MAG TPA: hypothetical protein VGK79_04220 [Gaiellaceae bacterium]|jgi:hypothetical protein